MNRFKKWVDLNIFYIYMGISLILGIGVVISTGILLDKIYGRDNYRGMYSECKNN